MSLRDAGFLTVRQETTNNVEPGVSTTYYKVFVTITDAGRGALAEAQRQTDAAWRSRRFMG